MTRLETMMTALMLVVGMFSRPAAAAVRWVENYGVDSPTCGSISDPCRSISRAIANSAALDVILVGPGRYGDLDFDGAFTSPGDEAAEIGSGCDCVVKVDKQLVILGRRGPAATAITYGVSDTASLVKILASRVVFSGFLLTGRTNTSPVGRTTGDALTIGSGDYSSIFNNWAFTGGSTGFHVMAGKLNRLLVNQSIGQNTGFYAESPNSTILASNLAIGNQNGFLAQEPSSIISANQATGQYSTGFILAGTGQRVLANQASVSAGAGFEVAEFASNELLAANVAAANLRGFDIYGVGHSLVGGAAVGSADTGIAIRFASTATIKSMNIFGNGLLGNCGVHNQSGTTVNATFNFWGASGGPGADPADLACDDPGSTTVTSPSLTVPLP
jgi:Periplasmic copper-binding protein (NosD)